MYVLQNKGEEPYKPYANDTSHTSRWIEYSIVPLINSTGTGKGENLAYKWSAGTGQVSPPSAESLVQGRNSWVAEKSWTPMGGHYTQMVWNNTKEVGCAIATSNGKTSDGMTGVVAYLVCRLTAIWS